MSGFVRNLTSAELAARLGCAESSIKTWVSQGLPCDRPGRPRPNLYAEAEVRAWLEERGLTPGRQGKPPRIAKLLGASAGAARPARDTASADESPPEPPPDEPPRAEDQPRELARKEALAKARREWWRAQIDRLKAQREAGRLVDREEVIALHAQMVLRARARLMSIPGAAAASLAAEVDPREIERVLEGMIREALEEVSRGMQGEVV